MITAPLLSLFVIPTIYKLLGPKRLLRQVREEEESLLGLAHPEPAE